MTASGNRFGLGVALVTPFLRDGSVDLPRLTTHARRCVDECIGVERYAGPDERLPAFHALALELRADIRVNGIG